MVPHAGAGPHVLAPLLRHVPDHYEVLGVTLPGRERRCHEPCTTTPSDPDGVVAAILAELAALPTLPTVLFGHSLGAAIASAALVRAPELFTAGVLSAHPSGSSAAQRAGRWSDEELVAVLRCGGGTPEEVLGNSAWRRQVLDRLRSDLTLSVRLAHCHPAQPIGVPLTVLVGDRDEIVPAGTLDTWRVRAPAGVRLRTFRGGHFFLLDEDNRAAVATEITAAFGAEDAVLEAA
ncbi:thioesterase II family protein [Geodermatophilus maliterrae]|uniref:Thioesterase II family protein n=1 Tax=Geodermatophilus maliterrae TaxID=3162531 RepID=A0ABV3XB97_9ACTN